jgi:hypothetical protein
MTMAADHEPARAPLRKTYYPEITDWHPYNAAETPPPR